MCRSTEATDAQNRFAAEVSRKLLSYIDAENNNEGRCIFLVSHAWTEGPMMYLVYTAPPYDITLGLVRDTRESNIGPGPWLSLDAAVTYYYITDFEEGGGPFSDLGEPDTILWYGDRHSGLPERPSDIPDVYRYTPPPKTPSAKPDRNQAQRVVNEPRRYADPL
jgi:hypothetical protein